MDCVTIDLDSAADAADVASVLDLQMRIDREFVIVGVERHSLVASTSSEGIS
jgi:hypothetical protein